MLLHIESSDPMCDISVVELTLQVLLLKGASGTSLLSINSYLYQTIDKD